MAHCVAIHKYTAQKPDEVSLEVGEFYHVLGSETDGWIRGRRVKPKEGIEGVFPSNFVQELSSSFNIDNEAFDYDAQEQDELTLKKGDIVVVLCSDVDEGWLRGILNGKIGVFPANFVKLIPRSNSDIRPSDDVSPPPRSSSLPKPASGDDKQLESVPVSKSRENLSDETQRVKAGAGTNLFVSPQAALLRNALMGGNKKKDDEETSATTSVVASPSTNQAPVIEKPKPMMNRPVLGLPNSQNVNQVTQSPPTTTLTKSSSNGSVSDKLQRTPSDSPLTRTSNPNLVDALAGAPLVPQLTSVTKSRPRVARKSVVKIEEPSTQHPIPFQTIEQPTASKKEKESSKSSSLSSLTTAPLASSHTSPTKTPVKSSPLPTPSTPTSTTTANTTTMTATTVTSPPLRSSSPASTSTLTSPSDDKKKKPPVASSKPSLPRSVISSTVSSASTTSSTNTSTNGNANGMVSGTTKTTSIGRPESPDSTSSRDIMVVLKNMVVSEISQIRKEFEEKLIIERKAREKLEVEVARLKQLLDKK